jgi:MFS transporter, NNP family, nitrate/nitrite transporter
MSSSVADLGNAPLSCAREAGWKRGALTMLGALRDGHWPTLLSAWLHLTLSFMVWLLIGALGGFIADDFRLTSFQIAMAVAFPLLAGAVLRILAGWSCDWFGAKPTGVVVLILELAAVLWGWLGVDSYQGLLTMAVLLGAGGASFAVALPITARAYAPEHQGVALGAVASGNVGTVLVVFFAPRLAAALGWHSVFGLMALPIGLTLVLFALMARDDRRLTQAARPSHWWRSAAEMVREPFAYWLCFIYAVTFGGFVGLCSALPIVLRDQYGIDLITAGTVTAVCGLVGSLIRPVGGYAADRLGGLRLLQAVLPALVVLAVCIGTLPRVHYATLLIVAVVGVMGFGNGIVFQVVSEYFHRQIGLASGLVGAAGGLGGFLLPVWLGLLKETTGSYRFGFWAFAVAAAMAWIGTVAGRHQSLLGTAAVQKERRIDNLRGKDLSD